MTATETVTTNIVKILPPTNTLSNLQMIKHSMKNTLLYALLLHLLLAGISPHTSFAHAAKGVKKRITKSRVPRVVNNSRNLGKGYSYSSKGYNNYSGNSNSNNRNQNQNYNQNQNGYNNSGYNRNSNYSNSSSTTKNNAGLGFWGITGIIALAVLGTILAYLAVPQILCSHKHEKLQAQKAKEASSYQRYSEQAVKPAVQKEVMVIGGIPVSKYKSPRGSDVMTL